MKIALPVLLVAVLAGGWMWCRRDAAELRASPQTAAAKEKGSTKMEKATFGGGCFWGVEATFRQLKGVTATAVGYEGGTLASPTYHDVCTDRTGHAEVVQVEYDPRQISYEQLLDVFWKSHDPTTRNRQGPDVGTQYRSVIFYHTPQQKQAATALKEQTRQEPQVSPAHRHPDRSGRDILAGRRLSPAVSREARPVDVPHPLTCRFLECGDLSSLLGSTVNAMCFA